MSSPRGYSLQKELTQKGYRATVQPTDDEFIDDQRRWISTNIEDQYWLMIFFRYASDPEKITKSFISSEIEIDDKSQAGVKVPFKVKPIKNNIMLEFAGHGIILMLDQFQPCAKDSKGEIIEAKVTLRL